MKNKKIKKYTIIPLCLLIIVITIIYTVSPILLLNNKSLQNQTIKLFSNSDAAEIKFNGKISFHYSFGVYLKADDVEIRNLKNSTIINYVKIKSIRAQINPINLLFGKVKLKSISLHKPEFIITDQNFDIHALLRDIQNIENTNLAHKAIIIDGIILTKSHVPLITDIKTSLKIDQFSNKISSSGSFQWKEKRHVYKFLTAQQNKNENKLNQYVSFNIENDLLNLEFYGQILNNKILNITGQHKLNIANIRSFSEWFGSPLKQIKGFETLVVNSQISFQNDKVTITNAQFNIDDNFAEGNINITFAEKTKIHGTIDFSNLYLQPYIDVYQSKTFEMKNNVPFQFIEDFDLDLRISTKQISTTSFETGKGLISISVKDNRLIADIAELEICNGLANGQLEINKTGQLPNFFIFGYLQNITTDRCINYFITENIIHGIASAKLELSTQGLTWQNLVSALSGKWSINMPVGGKINMKLPEIIKVSNMTEKYSWKKLKGGHTTFDNLDISLKMINGTADLNSIMKLKNSKVFSGKGQVNLLSNTINYFISEIANKAKNIQNNQESKLTLNISGPWHTPEIDTNYSTKALPDFQSFKKHIPNNLGLN